LWQLNHLRIRKEEIRRHEAQSVTVSVSDQRGVDVTVDSYVQQYKRWEDRRWVAT